MPSWKQIALINDVVSAKTLTFSSDNNVVKGVVKNRLNFVKQGTNVMSNLPSMAFSDTVTSSNSANVFGTYGNDGDNHINYMNADPDVLGNGTSDGSNAHNAPITNEAAYFDLNSDTSQFEPVSFPQGGLGGAWSCIMPVPGGSSRPTGTDHHASGPSSITGQYPKSLGSSCTRYHTFNISGFISHGETSGTQTYSSALGSPMRFSLWRAYGNNDSSWGTNVGGDNLTLSGEKLRFHKVRNINLNDYTTGGETSLHTPRWDSEVKFFSTEEFAVAVSETSTANEADTCFYILAFWIGDNVNSTADQTGFDTLFGFARGWPGSGSGTSGFGGNGVWSTYAEAEFKLKLDVDITYKR
tara:strand:+ start:5920 stop:6984 length:1065 start_codon:yes stop_codon:yes gene_type:complete